MDNNCSYIIALYNKLVQERVSLEHLWHQVDTYIKPYSVNNNKNILYDSTATFAAETLVSGIWSFISNSAESWFFLTNKNPNFKHNTNFSNWLLQADEILKNSLCNSSNSFYAKSYEFYFDLVCYGTAIFSVIEDINNKKINHNTCNIYNTYLYNHGAEVDTVISKLYLTPLQAIEKFGSNNVSSHIVQLANKNDNSLLLFLQAVLPSKYLKNNKLKPIKMPYACLYIDTHSNMVVKQGGFYSFPYMITRWYTNTNQLYGVSPAINSLPDIKMLNSIAKTIIASAQKQVDPPILAPNEAVVSGIKTLPGGVIYGAIDPISGNQLIKPLNIGADTSGAYNLQQQIKLSLLQAFYNQLLSYNYNSNATATEVLAVNDQKLRLLGAKIATLQAEFLYPLLKRQLQLLLSLNLLPPLPVDIANNFTINDIDVDFTGAWNKYQKLLNNVNLQDLVKSINTVMPFDSTVASKVNWLEVLKVILDNNGLNKNLFNF